MDLDDDHHSNVERATPSKTRTVAPRQILFTHRRHPGLHLLGYGIPVDR